MANSIVTRYFDVTLTQGSNDAFVEAQIDTGILPENGVGFKILRLEILRPYLPGIQACSREWSITRDTKTAVANLSDPDCIYVDGNRCILVTSGMNIEQLREEHELSSVYIVEPTIYCQLDSALTVQAATMYMRLHYEEVKMSEVEILRILNNA